MSSRLKLFLNNNKLEVGLDEVARGCLLGRVYAAAVVWNPYLEKEYKIKLPNIKDSKKIKPDERQRIRKFIEDYAIDWSVAWVSEREIEEINIRNASMKAMHLALDKLVVKPEHILVDGNYFKEYLDIPYTCIIKGDNKYISIAAASILAKTHRDDYLEELVNNNPELEKYDLRKNSAYGTKSHIKAIKKFGITEFHRKTFGICKEYSNN